MEIKTRALENVVSVVELDGEMDLYNTSEFKKEFERLVSEGYRGIVVDFERLTYIDSSGIGALLYAFTQSKQRNVHLYFVHINGSVRKVIELTSLGGFFPVAEDVTDAVRKIKAQIR